MTVYLQFLSWYMVGDIPDYAIGFLADMRPDSMDDTPNWWN